MFAFHAVTPRNVWLSRRWKYASASLEAILVGNAKAGNRTTKCCFNSGLIRLRRTGFQQLLCPTFRRFGTFHVYFLGVLTCISQHNDSPGRDPEEPSAHSQIRLTLPCAKHKFTGLKDRDQWYVSVEYADLTIHGCRHNAVDIRGDDAGLCRQYLKVNHVYPEDQAGGYRLPRALSTASSMEPTIQNALSGRSSCLPSRISPNPLTVSLTGTYLPAIPVNRSAT